MLTSLKAAAFLTEVLTLLMMEMGVLI